MIEILTAVLLAALITLITRIKGSLTWPAACTAAVMLILITCMGGLKAALALPGMYAVVFIADMFFDKQREQAVKGIQEKGGIRGIRQVLANGASGCVCIFLYQITGNPAFLIAYHAAVFEVMTDSIASDLGVLSKRPPRDICTWKKVSPGISGGVSVLGLTVSAFGCTAAGLIAGAISGFCARQVLIVIAAAYLGMLADSVIGSVFQVRYVCCVCGIRTELSKHCGKQTVRAGGLIGLNNSMVNFLCTVFSAVIGYALTMLL